MIYINKYTIKPSPSFESEFSEIYRHIVFKLKERNVAKRFYDKVKKKIYSLEYFPERFVKISNSKNKNRNIRKLIIDKYIVIYEVKKSIRTSFYFTYFSL